MQVSCTKNSSSAGLAFHIHTMFCISVLCDECIVSVFFVGITLCYTLLRGRSLIPSPES